MKILITGSTGLLGQALSRHLASSCDVTGLSRHHLSVREAASHLACDLSDTAQTATAVKRVQPDVVIHTQALSDVDRCELEPALAQQMNVQTTNNLVKALTLIPAWLIHISTDYIFDGTKGTAYDEEDEPRPISVYAATKLAAEQAVLGYPRGVVVRPSTLFGPGRMNFCDYLVTQLTARYPVEAFTDQITSPTYTPDCAQAIGVLCEALYRSGGQAGGKTRIYHMTNAGACSRVAFAECVADLLGCPRELIRHIPMAAQQRPARRPAYSALVSTRLAQLLGAPLRPWHEALRAYLLARQ